MYYFNNINDTNNFVYSCDSIRINFVINEKDLDDFVKYFDNLKRLDVDVFRPCFTQYKYKYMLKVNYGISSMTIGWNLNGIRREDIFKGFLDVNPNKCFNDDLCLKDINFIKSCCEHSAFEIARLDLAIDIPVNRSLIRVIKDRRKYQLIQNSQEDKTEYLGQRSSGGYVKIYNKSIESFLDYDLTRVEITIDDIEHLEDIFEYSLPEIYIKNTQMKLDLTDSDLSKTQLVLIELLKQTDNPDYYLKQLNNSMSAKLKPYVFNDDTLIVYDYDCIKTVISGICKILL